MKNLVILIGFLGQAPELRHLPDGSAVATLSLATTRRWKDKASGEKREQVEWHRIILWRKLAEIAGEYLKKGSQIYVSGRLQTRKWTDNNGVDHYSTEIVGQEMHMLGKKDGQATGGRPPEPPVQGAPPDDDYQFDDDIPF